MIALTASLLAVPAFDEPALAMLIFCVLLGFPAATALVMTIPMYADVVDYDAAQSGLRRERLYNGAMSVVNKTALGLANGIVVLLAGFDTAAGTPIGLYLLGPVAAVVALVGVAGFARHPIAE